jgi:hypothetical protein
MVSLPRLRVSRETLAKPSQEEEADSGSVSEPGSKISCARTFLASTLTAGPALFVAHPLVQDLPDQSTQPVVDRAGCLGMSEAWDDPTVHDGKDRPLGLYRPLGRLIEDAPHLAIAFGQR